MEKDFMLIESKNYNSNPIRYELMKMKDSWLHKYKYMCDFSKVKIHSFS